MNNIKGAAIIIALIVVLLVMSLITAVTSISYYQIKMIENYRLENQAYFLVRGLVNLARAGLVTSGMTSSIDTLKDIWAQPLKPFRLLPGVLAAGYLEDEEGKFNIDSLINQDGNTNQVQLDKLRDLFSLLSIPVNLADNIAVYIESPRYAGNKLNEYTMGKPPSRTAGKRVT